MVAACFSSNRVYGYADVLGHLATIRDEAERLRGAEAVRKRTLFMILTGPLMVLAVLGAAYGARRGWPARPGTTEAVSAAASRGSLARSRARGRRASGHRAW